MWCWKLWWQWTPTRDCVWKWYIICSKMREAARTCSVPSHGNQVHFLMTNQTAWENFVCQQEHYCHCCVEKKVICAIGLRNLAVASLQEIDLASATCQHCNSIIGHCVFSWVGRPRPLASTLWSWRRHRWQQTQVHVHAELWKTSPVFPQDMQKKDAISYFANMATRRKLKSRLSTWGPTSWKPSPTFWPLLGCGSC